MNRSSLFNWLTGLAMHARITGSEALGGDREAAKDQARLVARLAVIDARETLEAIDVAHIPDAGEVQAQRNEMLGILHMLNTGMKEGRVHLSPEIADSFRQTLERVEEGP